MEKKSQNRKCVSVNYGIVIKPIVKIKIIEETLTRIGICNKKTKKMTPSCYIKNENGTIKLWHFKELLANDGYKDHVTNYDYKRRDSIASMLETWGMIKIMNRQYYTNTPVKIFVLKSKYKSKYEICHKYEFKQ